MIDNPEKEARQIGEAKHGALYIPFRVRVFEVPADDNGKALGDLLLKLVRESKGKGGDGE